MEYVIAVAVGILVGSLIGRRLFRPVYVGTLFLTNSDQGGADLYLNLESDVHTVRQSEYVILKVNAKSYNPPK